MRCSELADMGMRAMWQAGSTESALRSALADLNGFNLRGPDKTVYAGCSSAADALADAVLAIRKSESAMTKIEQQQLKQLAGGNK